MFHHIQHRLAFFGRGQKCLQVSGGKVEFIVLDDLFPVRIQIETMCDRRKESKSFVSVAKIRIASALPVRFVIFG